VARGHPLAHFGQLVDRALLGSVGIKPGVEVITRIAVEHACGEHVPNRDEYLNGQRFETLVEAQVLLEDWRIDYNMNRPHSAHGWLTPVEFVETWLNQQQLQLA
jgi:transposase InsO family protein